MLLQIKYLLFKLKLIQPSEKTISLWMYTQQVEKLEYALAFGNYKTRKLAAEALGVVGKSSSIPVLLKAINDNVHNVSVAALNTLEIVGKKDNLIQLIVKKRFDWMRKIRESNAKYETNKNKKYKIFRWDRASKKSFDRVKEQLKRPIR
ncbi:HEAT repeat domain-containing protein [Aestuariivivens marinum]|uniref:HEAT repeat domain-containing protein n=1 Tax=Aestuariivivens marinum TaxID=2913555 RepID=UPI001F58900C|nr:HEAT repeat domain-containing protein [Aestuariivivens marinum]